MHAEKVALKELGEQRRGMEPTQNGSVRPQHDVGPHLLCRTDRGRGIRGEAGGGERRSSDQPETKERGEPAEMRERRGLEGRSSRARRALCGVWAGVAVSTWGRGWAPEASAKYPQTSAPTSGGRRDASEGRPLLNHREAGVGRRRPTGGALHCWIGAGKREKWGTHLAPAAESPRGR